MRPLRIAVQDDPGGLHAHQPDRQENNDPKRGLECHRGLEGTAPYASGIQLGLAWASRVPTRAGNFIGQGRAPPPGPMDLWPSGPGLTGVYARSTQVRGMALKVTAGRCLGWLLN